MSKSELMKWHEPRVKLLSESKVDILAIETMPGIKEADAIIDLLEKYPKGYYWFLYVIMPITFQFLKCVSDAYVSFTCREGGTNAGESFETIAEFLETKSKLKLIMLPT